MKKFLNIVGHCITAVVTAGVISLMFGLTVVIFYRHIPTFGMDSAERAISNQNDGLNVIAMYTAFFIVALVIVATLKYKKYIECN